MEKILLNLATAEILIFEPCYGLSDNRSQKLCGYAGKHATNEDEYAAEVLSYAGLFMDFALGVLSTIDEEDSQAALDAGVDKVKFSDDHIALQDLITRYNDEGYDQAALEAMAREMWKDMHDVDENSAAPALTVK